MSESDAGNPVRAEIGRVLDGRYRLEGLLGAGSIGVVYHAEHTLLRRPVALKILQEPFGEYPELRARFEREAKALSALSHPNVVTITDFGFADDRPYLVMECLEGRTLAEALGDGFEPERAIDIVRAILRGLAYVHERGLLHRDLKPGNIFLQRLPDDPDHVRILDFGLVKMLAAEDPDDTREPSLTPSGAVLGTPYYMSPEQAAGLRAGPMSDVYAVGVLLYELLFGEVPFDAPTRTEILQAHMLEPVPRLDTPREGYRLEPALRTVIRKALAKEPGDRFPNAAAMLASIDALSRPAVRREDDGDDTQQMVRDVAPAASVGWLRWFAGGAAGLALLLFVVAMMATHLTSERADSGESDARAVEAARAGTLASASMDTMATAVAAEAAPSSAGTVAPSPSSEAEGAGAPSEPAAPEPASPGPASPGRASSEPASPQVGRVGVVDPLPRGKTLPAASGSAERPVRADPFAQPMPDTIARYHRRVVAGQALSRSDHRDLRYLQRRYEEDPRPSLLLARDFMARQWYEAAAQRYLQAGKRSEIAKGDRRMLPDLLHIVRVSHQGLDRAMDVVVELFGGEAIEAVEDAILRTEDRTQRGRLEALRERL